MVTLSCSRGTGKERAEGAMDAAT